jgi:uncharacterized Zn-binding protein involved in type VI secretion
MRPFIVMGDRTSHGGVVIGATQTTETHGKRLARVGDQVTCPKKGHGTTVIVTGDPTMIVDGAPVARHGDLCACGAVLIASQFVSGVGDGGGSAAHGAVDFGASTMAAASTAFIHAASDAAASLFDHRFVLNCDLTDMPLAKQPYRLRWKDQVIEGVTDAHGQTAAIPTGGSAAEVTCEILGEEVDG